MARAREAASVAVVAIDDLDDPRLADYAHLRAPSVRMREERARGIFTVEGWLSLEALVASPYLLRSVLVGAEVAERAARIVPDDVPAYAIPMAAIEQVTGVDFHRGVLAVAERTPLPSVEEVVRGARRLLVVEGVNDHENLGALFRNAAAFGVDAVLLDPTAADPLYRRTTRVSLGHVLRVPFARVERGAWPAAVGELAGRGFSVLALTPAGDALPLGRAVATAAEQVAVLVGAEGPGLSAEVLAVAGARRVRIPMAPGTDSVNVATAAAIALAALYDRAG
jgi:tRNA G18 (ribose-2'-O)-methylase SpoU